MFRDRRTFTPRITSRFRSIVRTASEGLAYFRSSSSPCRLSGDRVDWPTTEMFSSARTRVCATSMMYLRNPGNVWAPAEPASITVVTPLATQLGSGGMPSGATPS